jgi:transcriptional regulator with XRE-family HTH domain
MVQLSLRAARVNAGYSQEQAASELSISRATLSAYEKDSSNISYSLLTDMSHKYGIPLDNLFVGDEYELTRTKRTQEV